MRRASVKHKQERRPRAWGDVNIDAAGSVKLQVASRLAHIQAAHSPERMARLCTVVVISAIYHVLSLTRSQAASGLYAKAVQVYRH